MEKDQKVLLGILAFIFAVVIGIGVYLFITRDDKSLSDAAKFKKEYESLNGETYEGTDIEYLEVKVDKDNLFKYASEEEALKLLKNDTALIYFGFAPCPYCRSMINILNDVAKENEIEIIYYVDILNSRDTYEVINGQAVKISSGTENYYKILDILKKYLTDYEISDKDGKSYPTGVKRLYAPTVVAVKEGQVVGFHEVTVDTAVKGKHLTKEEASQLKDIYQTMIDQMNSDMCTSKGC